MIKRIFILCLSILVIGYLVVAITTMNRKPDNEVCKGMELTVRIVLTMVILRLTGLETS